MLILAGVSACDGGMGDQSQESTPYESSIAPGDQFQDIYQQFGGELIFGSPLTDPYEDVQTGRVIQYFKKIRLEYDQQQSRLFITPLGAWALPAKERQVPAQISPSENGRIITGTDFIVQDEFLTFYEKHGGESIFGLPISGQLDEAGTRVQYFENVSLEWHPEASLENRIQVGMLGEAHFWVEGPLDQGVSSQTETIPEVNAADVRAYVKAPILHAGEEQVVFVNVSDNENHRPVRDAHVVLSVSYNDITETIMLPLTDDWGDTKGALQLSDVEPGQSIKILVSAFRPPEKEIGETSLSYKTWW